VPDGLGTNQSGRAGHQCDAHPRQLTHEKRAGSR
jgi:hypothetical protein